MTAVALPVRPAHTASGQSPDILPAIYREGVNMAIWQRQLDPSLQAEAEALLAQSSFRGHKLSLPADRVQPLTAKLTELAPYPQLAADIGQLTEMFSCLFELQVIGLRLTPLSGTMCPKFHVDHVPCRLITTYLGPGTEWLPEHRVERSRLGPGRDNPRDSKSGLYSSADAIHTLAAGDVALLKGEAWEGNEGGGLVHRSPDVAPGQRRLLLTLDFI